MMRRLEDMVQQNDVGALEAFDKNITSTILGHGQKAKTFVLAEEYVVQNILTIIQRLSKQCDAPFDGFYEALCEYAHPNYIGMMGVYTQSDDSGGLTTFTDGRTSRTNPTTFIWMGALATSLDLVGNSLERWQDSSKRLAAFAERRSYEQGTWPADVEYPINRLQEPQ
jgi:hypothetical protein